MARLQALLARQQRAFNEASVGRRVAVLLERPGGRPGQLAGRSPHMQVVNLEAEPALLGSIVELEITHAHALSLRGRCLSAPPAPHQPVPLIEAARTSA